MAEGVPDFVADELRALDEAGLRRQFRAVDGPQGPWLQVDGQRLLSFASNSYLDLTQHPMVLAAAAQALEQDGSGAGAARLVTGSQASHRALEAELAAFKGCEDAVLFSSGYLANLALSCLLRPGDAVFSDAHNHASIVDGCRLSRADVYIYRHLDLEHLDAQLAGFRREAPGARALVVSDTVFSMDGDLVDLPGLLACCRGHGALSMIDEAHATGLLGPDGRGAAAAAGLSGAFDITMGTCSKSLGSAGGFLAGRAELCELLRNKARGYMFDTAPAPASAAAARAALEVCRSEPSRRRRCLELAQDLHHGLLDLGMAGPPPAAAIVPIVIGDARAAVERSAALQQLGILVPAIRPPAVPLGSARLRATLSAGHSSADVARLLAGLQETA